MLMTLESSHALVVAFKLPYAYLHIRRARSYKTMRHVARKRVDKLAEQFALRVERYILHAVGMALERALIIARLEVPQFDSAVFGA